MIRKEITISSTGKLNTAPAALLVQNASRFESGVYVEQTDKIINAKSIMGAMTLRIVDGEQIVICCDGSDEDNAIECITNLLTGK